MARGGGRLKYSQGGGHRGEGRTKHGLSRWATIWMDDIFQFLEWWDYVENYEEFSDDADDLLDAAEELYEIAEDWQEIGSMMGGTVFLDYCMKLAYKLANMAFKKAKALERAGWAAAAREDGGGWD
jgi:hypothetical protein